MKASLRIMRTVSMFSMILLAIFLTACGGDGGEGGVSPPVISYTGLTTQSTIDENNAEDLATGAFIGYSVWGEVGLVSLQSGGQERIGQPLTVRLPQVLEEALHRLDIASHLGGPVIAAIQCDSEMFLGDCGGSSYGYVCVDDVTGDFDGHFEYNSYCSEDVTISGRVDFSGGMDLTTLEFLQLSFSFESLTVVSGADSLTLAGTISYDFTSSPVRVTMDMLYCDNSTGKVYWVANYSINVTEGSGYLEVEISGRYYDPDYGYVEVYTEEPLRIYDGDDWPSDGVLVITGDTGIVGGSTMARLTPLSSTTYQVEADTDGDGTYDWDSGVLYWSDL
jgi:hypothetical protein